MEENKKYNDEEVWYCETCLSLKIMNFGEDEIVPCYCAVCGSTDIGTIHIDEWEKKYVKKNHKKYLNK